MAIWARLRATCSRNRRTRPSHRSHSGRSRRLSRRYPLRKPRRPDRRCWPTCCGDATRAKRKSLIKLINGDMRMGVKQSLVEEAIAVASEQPLAALRNAVMLEADLSRATEMAFEGSLGEARMRLFHPLGFMLASPVETPEEAVARFTEKPVVGGKKGRGKTKGEAV